MIRRIFAAAAASLLVAGAASAQELAATATPAPASAPDGATAGTPATPAVVAAPAATKLETAILSDANDYKIGPEDLLDISVWKNPELSRTVPVRPDGKVSLPLVNDIQAAGLTPTALRQQLIDRLAEFIPAPEVAVIVREVHSMKVAVVGSVKTPDCTRRPSRGEIHVRGLETAFGSGTRRRGRRPRYCGEWATTTSTRSSGGRPGLECP